MKKYLFLFVALASITMTACGYRVEVPPAHVGKIQTPNGFSEDTRPASRFRLSKCFFWEACDKLVSLDVSDQRYTESFSTFMPEDELNLAYGVSLQLSIDPSKYDFIFGNVTSRVLDGNEGVIDQQTVYSRYGSQRIQTVLPQIVAQWTINEIASNRERVNQAITDELRKQLADSPFIVKFAGLTNVDYPEIIITAKEAAAQRREEEQQMLAQRTLDLLAIQTEKEVEEARREVELQKAATQSMIAEEMMTPAYETLLKYQTLGKMAESSNKVIVPTGLLDGIAVQNQL